MVMSEAVWFWQDIVSPHMVGLAQSLAGLGREVTYVAEEFMSKERASQGWRVPETANVNVKIARTIRDADALLRIVPLHSIHICQGIRSPRLIGYVRARLAAMGVRQWVIMESVNDLGPFGFLKRGIYRGFFLGWRNRLDGVLAIGASTPDWIVARGLTAGCVYPFAYFLDRESCPVASHDREDDAIRFVFVGRLVPLKRVDLLIESLSPLNQSNYTLTIIGDGPELKRLKGLAEARIPGKTNWIGKLTIQEVRTRLETYDCLILPSQNEGWGAVVSEALMRGTPAIVSDQCGSACVVNASRCGGTFKSGDVGQLQSLLANVIEKPPRSFSDRLSLARWAECLSADAGAAYLSRILEHVYAGSSRPCPPWSSSVDEN